MSAALAAANQQAMAKIANGLITVHQPNMAPGDRASLSRCISDGRKRAPAKRRGSGYGGK
jgi:hypothetical protein